MRNLAIILAAGSGDRMRSQVPKQLLKLSGRTVLEHTIEAFSANPRIDKIFIICPEGQSNVYQKYTVSNSPKSIEIEVVEGGKNRNLSTMKALEAIPDSDSIVLIHDGVRPLVSQRIIDDCVDAMASYDAIDTTVPATDTIVKIANNAVVEIPNRRHLHQGQTPQGFKLSVIRKAYALWAKAGMPDATDDCGLVLSFLPDVEIGTVLGDLGNIKITQPLDMYLAEKLFHLRAETALAGNAVAIDGNQAVAVVLGGRTGIGKSIATLLTSKNFKVVSLSKTENGVDITEPALLELAFREARRKGPISLVINCAAVLTKSTLEEASLDNYFSELRVNLFGSVVLAKVAFPFLRETQGQLFLFGSSSYTRGRAGYSAYSSSKAALVNLSQALADEWEMYGIKVNCVNPDRTKTHLREEAFGQEDPATLMDPQFVAEEFSRLIGKGYTGMVFDVSKG